MSFWTTRLSNRINNERKSMNKEWYQSKTMWLNIITIGLGVFEVITKTYPLDPQTLVLINGIGNLLLRVISKEQITFGGKPLLRR